MLTCFNVQKTHYFSNTVHYCSSSMPPLSQTRHFLQSPSFWRAQSALIGQLTQCIVIGRTPQALVGNVTPLSIIASFSFQVSFTISSNPKKEQSHMTDTVMMLVYIFSTQAAVKTISVGLYTPLWCDLVPLTHTHTHTHDVLRAKLRIWQSIANTWTNNKTYLQSLIQKRQIVTAKLELTLFLHTASPCHGCNNSTAVTETTPSFFAWSFGRHYANISTSWRRHVGVCLNEPF